MTIEELTEKNNRLEFELSAADAENARLTTERETLISMLRDSINTDCDLATYERIYKYLDKLK